MIQGEGSQETPQSQVPDMPASTEVDPNQLRIRFAQINAKRRRKLTWQEIASRVHAERSVLASALTMPNTPGKKKILTKVDRHFTRLERQLA